MEVLFNSKTLEHPGGEYERPDRISEFASVYSDTTPRINGEAFFTLAHSPEYIREFKSMCKTGGVLAEVQVNKTTYTAECISMGLSIQALIDGNFAVTRPPGHHAGIHTAEGFCFVNHTAVDVLYAIDYLKNKKVAVLDFDAHRGNGTQEILKNNPNVLYCSIHEGNEWKAAAGSFLTKYDGGLYQSVLVMPKGSGDDLFKEAASIMVHIISDFDPDRIVVSAGFDGHQRDGLMSLRYTDKGFYEVGSLLRSLKRPVSANLEGGYSNLIGSIESFIRGVNGKPFDLESKQTVSSYEVIKQFRESAVPLQIAVRN